MSRSTLVSRLLITFAALAIFWSAVPAIVCAQSEKAATLYVSPEGDDRWSGFAAEPNGKRDDGPFATLAKAQSAIRDLRRKSPHVNIDIVLRGGTHRLEKTLVLSREDSGDSGGTISFVAYPSETPILSSGIPIRGWKKMDVMPDGVSERAAGNLWMAEVPAQIANVLTLYDGLQRLPRSRGRGFTPPHGWKEDAAGRGPCNLFYFPESVVDDYAGFRGAELLVMPTANYEMNILPIAYVDRKRLLGVTESMATRPIGPMKFHTETMWIENRLEDLDEPGEWVFDADKRAITLWPVTRRPSDKIVAPCLTELVRIEGDIDFAGPRDEPARNVNFKGLTFAHAERLPQIGQDGWDLQHCWEKFDAPSALVRLRGAENCTIDSCRFVASGGTGVRMDLHCQHNEIRNCELTELGGVGVLLAGYGPGTKDVHQQNRIVNNWVHDIGQLYWASPAIFVWQSGKNEIANNLVHNTPYTGIVVSGRIGWNRMGNSASVRTVRWHEIGLENPPWSWSAREPYLHGRMNRVERNDIHTVMERLGDGNAIYVSGTGRDNLIKENYIHDIDSDHDVAAIRCDDDQEETTIAKNVVINVRSMHQAIIVKGPNDIYNNFLVNLRPSRLKIDPRWQLHGYIGLLVVPATGAKIEHNIIYCPDPTYVPIIAHRTYGTGAEPKLSDCDCDYNLYYCPRSSEWAAKHLETERGLGVEKHSLEADPLFVDVEQGDLRLKPESPAFTLGIEPIDVKQTGLSSDHPYYRARP